MNSLNKNSFFYTTFGGETLSIAAAISTINFIRKNDVCKKISIKGHKLINNMNKIIENNGINYLNVTGYGQRSILTINHENALIIKTFIHQEFLKNKILWNGIINLSYSHSNNDIDKICLSFNNILKNINNIGLNDLNKKLLGKPIKKLIL